VDKRKEPETRAKRSEVTQSDKPSKLSRWVVGKENLKIAALTAEVGYYFRNPKLAVRLVSTFRSADYSTREITERLNGIVDFAKTRSRKVIYDTSWEAKQLPYAMYSIKKYESLLVHSLKDRNLFEKLTDKRVTGFASDYRKGPVLLYSVARLEADGHKLLDKTMVEGNNWFNSEALLNRLDLTTFNRYLGLLTRENVDLLTDKDVVKVAVGIGKSIIDGIDYYSAETEANLSYLELVARMSKKITDHRILELGDGSNFWRFDFLSRIKTKEDFELLTNDNVLRGIKTFTDDWSGVYDSELNFRSLHRSNSDPEDWKYGRDYADKFVEECKSHGTAVTFKKCGLDQNGNSVARLEESRKLDKLTERIAVIAGARSEERTMEEISKVANDTLAKGRKAEVPREERVGKFFSDEFLLAMHIISATPYKDRVSEIEKYVTFPVTELKEFESIRMVIEVEDTSKMKEIVDKITGKTWEAKKKLRYELYKNLCWDDLTRLKYLNMLSAYYVELKINSQGQSGSYSKVYEA
jgi:hypothetical protein